MTAGLVVRAAQAADFSALRAVVAAAFGRPDEADLVARLRADGDVVLALVAFDGGEPVGAVLFSRLTVAAEPAADIRASALAPLAVVPDRQGRGIGTALVRDGLDRLAAAGEDLVLVLGDPAYYGRFGFHPGRPERMVTPYPVPENQWLAPGDRPLPLRMTIAYPRAFAALG